MDIPSLFIAGFIGMFLGATLYYLMERGNIRMREDIFEEEAKESHALFLRLSRLVDEMRECKQELPRGYWLPRRYEMEELKRRIKDLYEFVDKKK